MVYFAQRIDFDKVIAMLFEPKEAAIISPKLFSASSREMVTIKSKINEPKSKTDLLGLDHYSCFSNTDVSPGRDILIEQNVSA